MITTEEIDGTVVVRLDHGPVNALDVELCDAITETFAALTDADAVVVTGSGRAFSAGVDLRQLVQGGAEHVGAFLPALSQALLSVFTHPRPVVAAINGHAIAGGCLLAAAADRRVMAAGSIGLTELLVGVPFPTAAFEIARWATGSSVDRLVTTGVTLGPADAESCGLVHEVTAPEQLMAVSLERAAALAGVPHPTFALTKRQLRGRALAAIDAGGDWDEQVLAVWRSEEVLGRMASYLESLGRR